MKPLVGLAAWVLLVLDRYWGLLLVLACCATLLGAVAVVTASESPSGPIVPREEYVDFAVGAEEAIETDLAGELRHGIDGTYLRSYRSTVDATLRYRFSEGPNVERVRLVTSLVVEPAGDGPSGWRYVAPIDERTATDVAPGETVELPVDIPLDRLIERRNRIADATGTPRVAIAIDGEVTRLDVDGERRAFKDRLQVDLRARSFRLSTAGGARHRTDGSASTSSRWPWVGVVGGPLVVGGLLAGRLLGVVPLAGHRRARYRELALRLRFRRRIVRTGDPIDTGGALHVDDPRALVRLARHHRCPIVLDPDGRVGCLVDGTRYVARLDGEG